MLTKKGFFITGTNTGIGKTVISAILVNKFNGIYWKPIQCGSDENNLTDSDIVSKILEKDRNTLVHPERFVLKEPLSPNIAANKQKIKIKLNDFDIEKLPKDKTIIIEGAGGLMVPINSDEMIIDLLIKFNLPVVLVASTKLGTINHTLLSLNLINNKFKNKTYIIFFGKENLETVKTIDHFRKKIIGKNAKILNFIPKEKKINLDYIKRMKEKINI